MGIYGKLLYCCQQSFNLIGFFPLYAQVFTTHVAVSSQLSVDGLAQFQCVDDCGGTQVEYLCHCIGDYVIGYLAGPKVSTRMETGSATPIA